MADMKCGSCGSTDIDTETEAGGAVCVRCGHVLEETNHIVSDLTFTETASGSAAVFGQFVSGS